MKKNALTFLPLTILFLGCQDAAAPKVEPVYEDTVVFQSGAEYFTFRIPSIIEVPNGDLIAFAEGRESLRDEGDIDLVMKRSSDLGQTWGELQVIIDNGPDTAGNPAPVFDRTTGRLWLPYCTNPADDPYDRDVWITYSDDLGDTWAESRKLTPDVKPSDWIWYATGPGRSIQLASGRLVVPANHSLEGNIRRSHVFFSDDQGETWEVGGIVEPATDESQVAELNDGRLMMNTRIPDDTHYRGVTISDDGGESWGPLFYDETLVDPMCQGQPSQYIQGLYFSNPATQVPQPRDHMTVRLSLDNGQTWPIGREIDAGPPAYSALAELTDGRIGLLWESGDFLPYETIRFAAFNRAWLQAGDEE